MRGITPESGSGEYAGKADHTDPYGSYPATHIGVSGREAVGRQLTVLGFGFEVSGLEWMLADD